MAVAQVVMNRVFSPFYPDSVCGVVYQNAHRYLACQFTFACEGKRLVVDEPDMWGLLLVDIARHASRAYARESAYTEDEALRRIIDMFEVETARPTDLGNTALRSQQGH